MAEFWLDSLEDWRKLWADPEFTEAVAGKSGWVGASPLYRVGLAVLWGWGGGGSEEPPLGMTC